ncbi:hypothetical protein PENARI_c009G12023 [Penicillium arizonense]|uniref:Dyp-type peroxidase n=1 Tax=Penicillium arizonense TaxID=1835702 RepID=A0A1F5LHV4_PENAI|nr:hypothetical protein PENARI_c009G12023 [Penicillium arizonense]OGE52784.1 hypothetical protein PENARI_c009G12023 [Penicillium arizonense]
MAEAEASNLDNIQGDIWPGLAKKYQIFWFFQITDASAFKPSLGKLLDDKVITSSADALGHRKEIYEVKTSQPGILHELAAVNIAFSFKGMQKLAKEKDRFVDDPFRKGMEADMVNEGRDRIEEWMDEFKSKNGGVDGVVLVCGTETKVKKTTAKLAKEYFSSAQGIKHIITLDGRERPEENAKHEHFGFLDAISQPRLTGFDKKCEKGDGNYQHMCRPGRIIIGHDGEMNNEPKSQHPPWAKDGSYLVIRKLKQYVPEFNSYLESEAPKLHFTEDQLGARLVGRWKSGAPVELHPDADCPKDARMNEFNYDVNVHTNCPFASHMRKTKPRSIVSDRDMNDIMRRGIPYGPEVGINETKTEQDRGLMFTCYQSSIGNGFQFLKRSWINLDTFPADKTEYTGGTNPGQDVIVGQLVKKPQKPKHKILTTSLVDGKGQNTTTSFLPFIQSNGGDYFFSPSLQLLRDMSGQCKREDSCYKGMSYCSTQAHGASGTGSPQWSSQNRPPMQGSSEQWSSQDRPPVQGSGEQWSSQDRPPVQGSGEQWSSQDRPPVQGSGEQWSSQDRPPVQGSGEQWSSQDRPPVQGSGEQWSS